MEVGIRVEFVVVQFHRGQRAAYSGIPLLNSRTWLLLNLGNRLRSSHDAVGGFFGPDSLLDDFVQKVLAAVWVVRNGFLLVGSHPTLQHGGHFPELGLSRVNEF